MRKLELLFYRILSGFCFFGVLSCHQDFTVTDNTCINEKLSATKNEVYNVFENISSLQFIREARIMSYNNFSAEVIYLNRKGDLRKVKKLNFLWSLKGFKIFFFKFF